MKLLEKHFDIAFAAPDGIQKLRELILTLAMRGKLVPQDPNVPQAGDLLEKIVAEKQTWVKDKKIKKPKPLPKIAQEDLPHKLPEGWKWVRLGDVSMKIHYGYTASANHTLTDVRLLRITDIQNNRVEWESVPGCDIKEKDIDSYLLSDNDILIARTGGTVGKSYLVENINVKAVFASYLIRVIPSKYVDINYLKFSIESPLYWKQLYEKCSGTGQPNVNGTSLSTLLLALPPLDEQCRIVAKIDQLMARCDELEKLRAERDRLKIKVHMAACDRLLTAPDTATFTQSWQFITQHFSELYSVKENVAELRKAILQLAVMGKLVPQVSTDTPAKKLLEEIAEEMKISEKKENVRKSNSSLKTEPKESHHQLPEGWKWIRLKQLTTKIGSGSTPRGGKSAYVLDGIPFLRSQNVWNNGLKMDNVAFITKETHEKMAATKVLEFRQNLL